MMKTYIKTIILFVIGIFLFSWYYFYECKICKKKEEISEMKKKLFLLDKKNVSFLGIYNNDKEIECVKEKGNWEIKKPQRIKGDNEEIERIIENVLNLKEERSLGKIENLEEYGLSSPAKKISIGDEGKIFTIFIGYENPSGSYFYITENKSEISLVSKWDLNSIIEKDIFALRDKKFFHFDKEKIKEIEIKRTPFYLLCKKGEKWNIEKPYKDIADKDKINELLSEIENGKAKSFPEEIKIKELLKSPLIVITLKENGNSYHLFIVKEKDNYYAKSSTTGYTFEIEKTFVEKIPENAEQLREHSVFTLNIDEIVEFEIKREKEKIYLKKENEKWLNPIFKETKFSEEKIKNFFSDLKYLKIEKFIQPEDKLLEKYKLKEPAITIKVKTKEGQEEQVHFGLKEEKVFYGYNPTRKIIFSLPSSDWEKINKKIKDFVLTIENK